jgi:hypothetical protein
MHYEFNVKELPLKIISVKTVLANKGLQKDYSFYFPFSGI